MKKVYKVKRKLFELGLTMLETPFGRKVRTYDRERTIYDIVRSRSRIDFQSVQSSLKEFRVDNVLQKYLEVLL